MKNSRPRIKYSQTPHSISRRIETLSNRTASALLSLLNRLTIGFGRGFIDLSYSQISEQLKIHRRTITTAAKLLEKMGDIVRERVSHGIYRWKILLEKDEIIEDPAQIYLTKEALQEPISPPEVVIDRSPPSCTIDHHHGDRSITTSPPQSERPKLDTPDPDPSSIEQNEQALKKVFKETKLKKQQQNEVLIDQPTTAQATSESKPATDPPNDDEPLHKILLKKLREYGVSQRVARQLCSEHDHEIIKSSLDAAPTLSGVKNVAGYLVAMIKDGGYEQIQNSQSTEQKKAPQVTGRPSNYAHLTNDNVKLHRHKTVKMDSSVDAPITYRTPKQTQTELLAIEEKKQKEEQTYRAKGSLLANRFKTLSEDVKQCLKQFASAYLAESVPVTQKRQEMLQDKTFQKLANRTVLENFFDLIDQGLNQEQAFQQLRLRVAA